MKEKNFKKALFNFRRSEEILELKDKSNMTEAFKLNFYLNSFILKFNISQCQYALLTEENDYTDFLERQIVKELLRSIEYNLEVIKISDDPIYKEGIINTEGLIKRILASPINKWQILYDFTHSEYLLNLMFEVDATKAQDIRNYIQTSSIKKVDYFLFYTHGFDTRGEWKDKLTEVITSNQRNTNINFILLPWDYGEFKIDYFLNEKQRKRVLNLFIERYTKILDLYGDCEKKCLIAHSFGTYITGTALQINPNFICNRIIFAGNILDPEYDWKRLRDNNQVEKVLIEQSTNDMPVFGAKILRNVFRQRWIGYAGRDGFNKNFDFVNVIPSKSGHSGMLTKENMSNTWFNFLVT